MAIVVKDPANAPPRRLTGAVVLYVAAVIALGIVALALVARDEATGWATSEPVPLAILMVAAVVAELTPLKFPRGNESEQISFSATFGLAAALGWGAFPAIVAMAAGATATGISARRPWWKIGFNAAQFCVSIAASAYAAEAITGPRIPGVVPAADSLHGMLAAGAVFVVLNALFVAVALALAQRMPLGRTVRGGFGFQFATAAAVSSLAPLVLVLVDWSPLLVPILLVPLVAVYQGGRAAGDKRRSEDRFKAIAQNTAELVLILDADGRITYASPSAEQILSGNSGGLAGVGFLSIVDPDDQPRGSAVLGDIGAHAGKVTTIELLLRAQDGPPRYFELVWNNLLPNHSIRGIVVNGRDVTERRVLEEELSRQAFHDPLTNLANRALFRDRVELALARASREDRPIAVMFLDVDNFKTINDSLGHAVGDAILVEVGRRLSASLRPGDTAARLGGDEFALLLEPAGEKDARIVADRLLGALVPPFVARDKEVGVRASIGIDVVKDGTQTAEEVLRNADVAMYAAKSHGKARYQVFEPSMHAVVVERLEIETDLQHAIERGELFLHYQPIVSLGDGRIVGTEALVRWQHPRRGLIAPGGIIPIAEESGLIVPIGRWVLREACRQAERWRSESPEHPLTVNVNVSAAEIERPDFVSHVMSVLDETRLDPGLLVIEITESTLMRDPESASALLDPLRRLGIRLAIDDFGTGYSSLSYLSRFPIDVLKIDRSFIVGLASGPEESALARAIVQIARTLKMQTIAEGIEHPEQVTRLLGLGCEMGQGYLLARPASPEEISALLAGREHVFGQDAGASRSRSAHSAVSR
ncbi:MAG: putative bifunctional diguanylate cyclase/phosphodiesterase [Actinomycetota bacterium]